MLPKSGSAWPNSARCPGVAGVDSQTAAPETPANLHTADTGAAEIGADELQFVGRRIVRLPVVEQVLDPGVEERRVDGHGYAPPDHRPPLEDSASARPRSPHAARDRRSTTIASPPRRAMWSCSSNTEGGRKPALCEARSVRSPRGVHISAARGGNDRSLDRAVPVPTHAVEQGQAVTDAAIVLNESRGRAVALADDPPVRRLTVVDDVVRGLQAEAESAGGASAVDMGIEDPERVAGPAEGAHVATRPVVAGPLGCRVGCRGLASPRSATPCAARRRWPRCAGNPTVPRPAPAAAEAAPGRRRAGTQPYG